MMMLSQYIGLTLTYASSFQMLRGAVIIFTGMYRTGTVGTVVSDTFDIYLYFPDPAPSKSGKSATEIKWFFITIDTGTGGTGTIWCFQIFLFVKKSSVAAPKWWLRLLPNSPAPQHWITRNLNHPSGLKYEITDTYAVELGTATNQNCLTRKPLCHFATNTWQSIYSMLVQGSCPPYSWSGSCSGSSGWGWCSSSGAWSLSAPMIWSTAT